MQDTKAPARPVTVAGVTYRPGDPIPDDVLAKITNPKAWTPLEDGGETPAPAGPAGTSSGHRLAGTVTIAGKSYGPHDFIPDDVAAKIRNPKAWESGTLPVLAPAAGTTEADNVAPVSGTDAGGDSGNGAGAAEGSDDKPPRKAAARTAAKPG